MFLRNLLLLTLTAASSVAAADHPTWTLRLRGLSSDYKHDFVFAYTTTSHLQIDNGTGYEAAVEIRPRKHLGFEFGIGSLDFDANTWTTQLRPISFDPLVLEEVTIFEDSGHFEMQPFTLALMIHPYTSSRFDWYIAPLVNWTRYDVRIESQEHEDDLGYGGKLGLEYIFGRSQWGLGVEYRHLELVHETMDRDQYGDIGLDVGSLIVSYRPGRLP
jgi:Outer membrane protein beta-barrel domain